jgi:hypothetical protein
MPTQLDPSDYELLDRYLAAILRANRKPYGRDAVRFSFIRLIEMVATDDAAFRDHMIDAIEEIQDE